MMMEIKVMAMDVVQNVKLKKNLFVKEGIINNKINALNSYLKNSINFKLILINPNKMNMNLYCFLMSQLFISI